MIFDIIISNNGYGAVVKRDHSTMALCSHEFDSRQLHHRPLLKKEGEFYSNAEVLELAYRPVSKTGVLTGMRVQLPPSVPFCFACIS